MIEPSIKTYYEISIADHPNGDGWEYNGQGVWLREIKEEDVDPKRLLVFTTEWLSER